MDTTADKFLDGRPVEEDGLGVHGCDIPDRWLYDYGIKAQVDTPDEAVELVEEIWRFWEDECGFQSEGTTHEEQPLDVRGRTQDFRGALTARWTNRSSMLACPHPASRSEHGP